MILSQKKATAIIQPWWEILLPYSMVMSIFACSVLYATSVAVRREVVLGPNDTVVIDSDLNFTRQDFDFNISHEQSTLERFSDSLFDSNPGLVSPIRVIGHPKTYWIYRSFPREHLLSLIVVLVALLLGDFVYSRLFYNAHLVQVICHLMEVQLDLHFYKRVRNNLVFTNTLHRADRKLWMVYLFHGLLALKLLVLVVALIGTVYFHSVIKNGHTDHLYVGLILELLLAGQILVLIYANLWSPLIMPQSLWGKLMKAYSGAVGKIDVVRGRSIPSPPFQKKTSERVLESLNPYDSSPNVRLILDLLAYRHGLGLGLKTLAALEIDVQNNWRPLKLHVSDSGEGLEVSWKDPLAVLYVLPVPRPVRLCYGLEISFPHHPTFPSEKIVEIVGYEEKRYYEQVWSATRANAVDLKLKESFTYTEVFPEVTHFFYPAFVDVWTIVDGQLISKSAFVCDLIAPTPELDDRVVTPNPIPKPPRSAQDSPTRPAVTRSSPFQKARSLQRAAHNATTGSNPFEGLRAKSLSNLIESIREKGGVPKSKSVGHRLQYWGSFKRRNKSKRLNSFENQGFDQPKEGRLMI